MWSVLTTAVVVFVSIAPRLLHLEDRYLASIPSQNTILVLENILC